MFPKIKIIYVWNNIFSHLLLIQNKYRERIDNRLMGASSQATLVESSEI